MVIYVDAERASDDNKNNYFIYGIGGLYAASDALSLAGGMHYTDPHYKRGADASIVEDNLGGLALDLGSKLIWDASTVSVNVSYTMPERAEYQEGVGRNSVTLQRAKWVLTLGLNLLFR